MTWFLAPEPAGPLSRREPPEFSVIIAAYEAAETIRDAVESALDQTHPPKEVVVCDDGSTDGTAEALDDLRGDIVLVRQENSGPSAARNAAIARASGEFVVNLDSDDVYLPRNLEARAELIGQRPDLDIVTTDGRVELDGKALRHFYEPSWRFETEDQRAAILERCFVSPFWSVRRSRLLEVGGFDEKISHVEDWECFIRLILSGSRAGLVDEPLGRYRLQRGSLSNQAVALAAAHVVAMEKTLASAELSEAERATARARLGEMERELSLARLREAVISGDPSLRKEARRVFADGEMPALTRAKALLSYAAPTLARRILSERGSETAAGIVIPTD
jgi:Glycosyl transferase family 2